MTLKELVEAARAMIEASPECADLVVAAEQGDYAHEIDGLNERPAGYDDVFLFGDTRPRRPRYVVIWTR